MSGVKDRQDSSACLEMYLLGVVHAGKCYLYCYRTLDRLLLSPFLKNRRSCLIKPSPSHNLLCELLLTIIVISKLGCTAA